MLGTYFFRRIPSFFLSLLILVAGSGLPLFCFPLLSKNFIKKSQKNEYSGVTGVLLKGVNEDNLHDNSAVLQRNKTIDFLITFDTLRFAHEIGTLSYTPQLFKKPDPWQENNSFYKDYMRTLLPEKKPEDGYLIVI